MQERGHTKAKQTGRTSERAMLPPIARAPPRHLAPKPNDGSDQHAASQPQEQAVASFARRRRQTSASSRLLAQRLNRDGHRLNADAFVEPEHHGQKKRDHQAAGERRFEDAREHRAESFPLPRWRGARENGKRKPRHGEAPRISRDEIRAPRKNHRRAERAARPLFAVAGFQHFLGEQVTSTTPTTRRSYRSPERRGTCRAQRIRTPRARWQSRARPRPAGS